MKEEIKAEWIRRLRSPGYVQGKQTLRTSEGTYCCLGVLCEIAVDAGVITRVLVPNTDDPGLLSGYYAYGTDHAGDRVSGVLPGSVVRWAEMTAVENATYTVSHGEYAVEGQTEAHTLVQDNDSGGKTFAEIADIIEQYF